MSEITRIRCWEHDKQDDSVRYWLASYMQIDGEEVVSIAGNRCYMGNPDNSTPIGLNRRQKWRASTKQNG